MASHKPPFTLQTAHENVKAAQALWNTKYVFPTTLSPPLPTQQSHRPQLPNRLSFDPSIPSIAPKTTPQKKKKKLTQHIRDPSRVALAYTPTSTWRNRSTFIKGHSEIRSFLTQKWEKEKEYRLRKELFSTTENKIAVQFWYVSASPPLFSFQNR